jgi:hypothetical protein
VVPVRKFRYVKLIVLICLWICFQSHSVFACRYNVRETGFIYLGTEPYYFYGYVSKDTPEEIISDFKQILHALLIDCNIRIEIINTDLQKDHPAMKYLDLWHIESFPAAILVSPDEQSLVVPVKKNNEPFDKTLLSAIDNILFSPIREEIIRKAIETYGVILLIEGENAWENKKYEEAALYAINNIKKQMKMMPKYIAHPPVLIPVNSEAFSREKILLWSLGIDVEDIRKPYAAVFYGRARWIGPLMKAEEITQTNLFNILSIIGADCECGLDISWVQGTMLPAEWDQERQAKVAKSLEFDPENPVVKMEVSRILKKASSFYAGVPVVYQDSLRKSGSLSGSYIIDENKSHLHVLLYITGGLAVITIITVLLIFFKAKRKNL